MKILVIQLLRLGDVFSVGPILKGILQKYPGCQIDLLINRECRLVENLLPDNVRPIYLDREALTHGLVDTQIPMSFSHNLLNELVSDLDNRGYDLLANLTQNRFSAHLAGLIGAEQKVGMHVDQEGEFQFGSSWFSYLNSSYSRDESRFHNVEIFKKGLRLEYGVPDYGFLQTQRGIDEAEKLMSEKRPYILIQALTSDEKKNWGLDNFTKYIKYLKAFFPESELMVLGAPSERAILDSWMKRDSIPAKLGICSIEGAYSLLKRAELLVTLDTSIKHLAAAVGLRCLEISIGSSDYKSLGAYCSGALIVQGKEFCSPCSHSSNCHRSSQFCRERIEPDTLSQLTASYISEDWATIQRLAQKNERIIEILRTRFSSAGTWMAEDVMNDTREMYSCVEQISWKLHVEFKEGVLPPVGTESLSLAETVRQKKVTSEQFSKVMTDFEDVESKIDRIIAKSKDLLRSEGSHQTLDDFRASLDEISQELPEEFGYYKRALQTRQFDGSRFRQIKEIRSFLNDLSVRCSLETKLLNMTYEKLQGAK